MPTVNQAMAQRQQLLREQIAIAQQHPDVRACMTDSVIFLAGGTRVLPMPNLGTLTAQQADMLVAQLRQG
jgi:Flp pilus assembly secretin CpaC